MRDLYQKVNNLQSLSFMKYSPVQVGILGGTFNPAHQGHIMISEQAIRRYNFDYIIWLVANNNPLKKTNQHSIFKRANDALKIVSNPKILVSTAVHDFSCCYSYVSIKELIKRFPKVKFSWLMGIDNIQSFRKWYRYNELPQLCEVIVFDRPVTSRLVNNMFLGLKTKPGIDKTHTTGIMTHRAKLCNISSTQITKTVKLEDYDRNE